jgi:hypothetical protein
MDTKRLLFLLHAARDCALGGCSFTGYLDSAIEEAQKLSVEQPEELVLANGEILIRDDIWETRYGRSGTVKTQDPMEVD